MRTLHHYDHIGLLVPSGRSERGYRLYTARDLLRLQQIQLGRRLGMALDEIRQMLDDPGFDHRAALLRQRDALLRQIDEAHAMIGAIEAALNALDQGDENMDPERLFDGFDPKEYEAEAEARWGDTDAYREASERTARYDGSDWKRLRAEEASILDRFVAAMAAGTDPATPEARQVAEDHRLHIDRWFYACSRDAHAGLAELYLADPRFEAYFERRAVGLARYVAVAIRANSTGA